MRTSKQFEEILQSIYKQYIKYEIQCYRPAIEELHFLCTTAIMDILLKQLEEVRKRNIANELDEAQTELSRFVKYLITQKDGYLNHSIREELLDLQKNQSQEYLKRYAQLYRYYSIVTDSRTNEKLTYIMKEYIGQYPIFQEFKSKLKLVHSPQSGNILRNGTLTGLFNYNSEKLSAQTQKIDFPRDLDKDRDLILLNIVVQEQDFTINSYIDDEWLKALTQIERCQKATLESFNAQNLQDILQSKYYPYQIAKEMKSYLRFDSRLENRQENRSEKKNYWAMTKFKLTHDQKLVECILSPQNSLIGSRISDQANQISFMQIGKFGNVLAAGCFDGTIIIYELVEKFLLYTDSKLEAQKKSKMVSSQNFTLNIHEGAVTAISLLYDEFYMISASTDLAIKLSCLRSRQALLVLKAHMQTIWHLTFAPAGYWFASASADGTALLWATDQIQCQRIFGPMSGVKIVEFTPSVEHLITAEESRAIRLWHIEKGECVYLVFTSAQVNSLQISLTGQFMVMGLLNGLVEIWYLPLMKKLKDQICIQRIDYHSVNSRDYIRQVSISADESTIMCCNGNRIGFFSVTTLMKNNSEDVFMGLFTSEQSIEYQKTNCFRNAQPLEIIETPDQLLMAQYLPQGYAIYISK